MADIKTVTIGSTVYDIKDATAREEISDVKSAISDVKSSTSAETEKTGVRFIEYELGTINSSNGQNVNSNTRIRTKNYLLSPIEISVDSTHKIIAVYYNENFQRIQSTNILTNTTTTLDYPQCKYIRFLCGFTDDSVITDFEAAKSGIVVEDYPYSSLNRFENTDLFNINDLKIGFGWVNNSNVWNNISTDWEHICVPVKDGDKISIQGSLIGYVAFVRDYAYPKDGEAPLFSTVSGFTAKFQTTAYIRYNFIAPSDAKYFIIPITYSGNTNNYEILNINGYDINLNAFDNISRNVKSSLPVWYAFGDSITQGYTSINGAISSVTRYNYVYYVSQYNNYIAYNYAEGGAGYNHAATVGEFKTAKQKIDGISFANCDLVTLAYGVNDWHYGVDIGTINDSASLGTTMCSNMKYCIEKIMNDNPLCKIIVILPMNNSAFGTGNTKANNWGYGADVNGHTLKDIVDLEIEICNYYGIEYVTQSVVNRENIQAVLSDGTHPIAELYPVMGANLARQIKFA